MEYRPSLDINTLSFIKVKVEERLKNFDVPNAPEPAFDCPEFWFGKEVMNMIQTFIDLEDKAIDEYYQMMNAEALADDTSEN